MEAKDLVELASEVLRVKEHELREELCRLRLRKGTGQGENPMKALHARRDLARVLTVLRGRQQGGKGSGTS
ncbi:MAG: 50S ribosomal protein L29 [Candidatus Binatia bacterium]